MGCDSEAYNCALKNCMDKAAKPVLEITKAAATAIVSKNFILGTLRIGELPLYQERKKDLKQMCHVKFLFSGR